MSSPLSLPQKLFLTVVVPLCMLGSIELLCRVADTPSLTSRRPQALEMPTWMLADDNARVRAARSEVSRDELGWLTLFEQAPGFRVRLIPGIEREVRNTFSLVPDPELQKYRVKANAIGFRGPLLSEQRGPATYRVLVFGDSSSFGWGIDAEESFWALLADRLQQVAPQRTIEVGNFAIPGDSSEYGRLVFETFMARYQPDLVILGFGANDAKRSPFSHTSQVTRFREQATLQTVRAVLHRSALVQTLDNLITTDHAVASERRNEEPPSRPSVSRRRFAQNLIEMTNQTRSVGAQSLLLSLCTPRSYSRVMERVAEQQDALFLNGQQLLRDAIPALRSGQRYPDQVRTMEQRYGAALNQHELLYVSSDGCHPNEVGHRLVSEALAELIAPLVVSTSR